MPYSPKSIALTLAMGLIAAPAFAESHVGPNGLPIVGGAEMSPEKTIVGNAVNSADHTTLVAAVTAAGLVDTLNGSGPFTVFAPVNAAFDALPDGTVETLLKPENREQLVTILTCHVVAADVMSEALTGMIADDGGSHTVETVGGCMLDAKSQDGEITLTDAGGNVATITNADVEQLNGVIHVIDTVMLPAQQEDASATETGAAQTGDTQSAEGGNPMVGGAAMLPTKDIIDNAVNSQDHTTLVAAVQAAGLVDTLKGDGPFTVFAPVNAAFEALPDGTVETLLMPENKDQLTKILTAHVVPGRLTASDISSNIGSDGFYHMQTASGDALSAKVVESGRVFIFDENGNAYEVTTADVMQSNGVIHVVDGVLLPR